MRELVRSHKNRVLAGVLGGISEHLGINANLLRVITVLATMMTGFFPVVFAYFIGIFFMKSEDA